MEENLTQNPKNSNLTGPVQMFWDFEAVEFPLLYNTLALENFIDSKSTQLIIKQQGVKRNHHIEFGTTILNFQQLKGTHIYP